jgi:hypothetical protein
LKQKLFFGERRCRIASMQCCRIVRQPSLLNIST